MTDEPTFNLEDGVKVLTAPTMVEREEALKRLLTDAWARGWEACDETYRQELAVLGVVLQLPGGPGMTPEALAVIGLFFAIWSHQQQHIYEKRPSAVVMAVWLGTGFTSASFLVVALFTALGWLR